MHGTPFETTRPIGIYRYAKRLRLEDDISVTVTYGILLIVLSIYAVDSIHEFSR